VKILLTGSAGFIGSRLARYIIDHTDWQIVGLDRIDFAGDLSRTANLPRDRFRFVFHDLKAPIVGATGRRILNGGDGPDPWTEPFDYVVHMAAGSHVDRSVTDPVSFFEDNVLGTVHLLEWCRIGWNLSNEGSLLYFGTDEVFGPATDEAFVPWARMNPLNPYSAAKAGGELACPAYVNCYGMRIMISHCTNVIGDGQDAEKFLPLAVKRIEDGEPVQVHTVGGVPCSRYYTHVDNVSSAVLHMLKFGDCIDPDRVHVGRYNITGEREVSNIELVENIGRLLQREPIIKLVENPPTRIRPDLRYRVCGDELAKLGWKPPVTFEEGLGRTVEALRTRPNSPSVPDLLDSPPQNDNRSAHGRAG
jgi:dTDP-glucose 4,6-dehydratase